MKKNYCSILIFCILALSLSIISCRKIEFSNERPDDRQQLLTDFFEKYEPTEPTVLAMRQFVMRENSKYDFAYKYQKVLGTPRWNKALVYRSDMASSALGRGGSEENYLDSTIVYIPFAREFQMFVNSILVMKIQGVDTSFRMLYDWEYKYFQPSNSTDLARNAHSLFYLFASLDNSIFGTKEFRLKDKFLFTSDMLSGISQRGMDPDSVDVKVTLTGGSSLQSTYLVPTEHCEDITYCIQWKKQSVLVGRGQATYNEPQMEGIHVVNPPCVELGTYTQCYTFWSYDNGGWNGSDPGSGSGGDDGSGGGAGGGSWEDPTNPDPCVGDPEIQPRGPVDGLDPCGGTGWEPIIEEPPVDPLNNETYLVDADFHGNRTYITPAGVAIKLPSGAKVRYYTNFDINVFPNGAMYAFDLPNSNSPGGFDTYVAYQTEYLMHQAIIVPKPEFEGYFKLDPVTKKIIKEQRYTFPPSDHAVPDEDGIIKAVRVRVNKRPDGKCEIVREFVEVNQSSSIPADANVNDKVNYSIEYSPVSEQSPTESIQIRVCPGDYSAPGDNTMTISEFAVIYGPALKEFLNDRLGTDVKIYLHDCNSTAVSGYSIDRSGVVARSSSQINADLARLNNNGSGLTSTDEQVAITGCIVNGKWVFNAVINSTRLGQVHQKFQNILSAAEAELRQIIANEVEHLRGVGKIAEKEEYLLPNGEKFFITQMGFFEKIASLYDVGYQIIKNGALPETVWDRGRRSTTTLLPENQAYHKSPFGIPPLAAGAIDQPIEDIAGGLMLLKTSAELLSRPGETFDNLSKAVTELSWEKAKDMLQSVTGIDNYNAGGDRAKYQGGRHTLQAATIFLHGLSALASGKSKVKKAGDELADVQKFVPDGTAGAEVAEAIRNAHLNNATITNISNDKLLTKNVVNGEERVVVITKDGEKLYSGKAEYDIDGVTDDVLKAADANDLVNMQSDPAINNLVKTQPQKFIDGKAFERRIVNDPATKAAVANKVGIDLSDYQMLGQVQMRTSDGSNFVADQVYIRMNEVTGKFDVVINEVKLSDAAPFTQNQQKFLLDLQSGMSDFELRNISKTYLGNTIPQGSVFQVKAMVKTVGDGTVNGVSQTFQFNPVNNSWN